MIIEYRTIHLGLDKSVEQFTQHVLTAFSDDPNFDAETFEDDYESAVREALISQSDPDLDVDLVWFETGPVAYACNPTNADYENIIDSFYDALHSVDATELAERNSK